MLERQKTQTSAISCERDRLLSWLREVLAGSDDIGVQIVVEEAADARSSVHITLRDVPGPLAGLEVRRLA
jgi:hypothetical protein